jgi:FG-GAP repeat protein
MVSGSQISKLEPSDGASQNFFSRSIAVSNGFIAVGSSGDDDNGGNSGSSYIFDVNCSSADINGDYSLDFFDISAFLNLFAAGNLEADFAPDGVLDFFDIQAFLSLFAAGCP